MSFTEEVYPDVTVSKGGKEINVEEFIIDENRKRLEFRNVTGTQNLWSFPLHDDILVAIWVQNKAGKMEPGRFHIHGVTPGETDPTKQNPDYWYGSFNHTERYGSAARTKV